MESDLSRIQALLNRPGESLSVEIKRWINPDQPEGITMLVRAALALRNHGGGYIVIGFDNETLEPDTNNIPSDVRALFHIDKLQRLVTRFASEPFEVTVEFPERDGQLYPVVTVPPGVKTPVATKSDLRVGDKTFISTDSVTYAR
jgi:predicted HTH transcriptional regulator